MLFKLGTTSQYQHGQKKLSDGWPLRYFHLSFFSCVLGHPNIHTHTHPYTHTHTHSYIHTNTRVHIYTHLIK